MHISESDIVKDGIYITPGKQLRKVTKLGEGQVHFLSKGSKPKQPFEQWQEGHNRSAPPSLDTFIAAVDHRLTPDEIDEFITDGALMPSDRA